MFPMEGDALPNDTHYWQRWPAGLTVVEMKDWWNSIGRSPKEKRRVSWPFLCFIHLGFCDSRMMQYCIMVLRLKLFIIFLSTCCYSCICCSCMPNLFICCCYSSAQGTSNLKWTFLCLVVKSCHEISCANPYQFFSVFPTSSCQYECCH